MSKMKPELFQYRTIWGVEYLAIIKSGYVISPYSRVIDIACSEKDSAKGWRELFSEKTRIGRVQETATKIQVQDLALYTHWPIHTKEFWDLLDEGVV